MLGTDAKVTVLLVDGDPVIRDWLARALDGSGFEVAGSAETAGAALDLVETTEPALLVIEQHLPDRIGTELVRELRRLEVHVPALLMSADPEPGLNEQARDAGAQATLLKTGRAEELMSTLAAVSSGRQSFDVRHPKQPSGRAALSPREREVLEQVAQGSTNREIAARLSIGDETVKTLLSRAYAKLGVNRRAEAVSEAHRRGLL